MLVEKLLFETQELKQQFLDRTEKYCHNYFKVCSERTRWSTIEWCQYFNIEPRYTNAFSSPSFPTGFYNTKNSKKYSKLVYEYFLINRFGFEKFLEKELKSAEIHYKNSIEKLALRIAKKELNEENLTLNSSRIGVNFETIITDGKKSVRAWTIIAEGAIQRPHYRYLIK